MQAVGKCLYGRCANMRGQAGAPVTEHRRQCVTRFKSDRTICRTPECAGSSFSCNEAALPNPNRYRKLSSNLVCHNPASINAKSEPTTELNPEFARRPKRMCHLETCPESVYARHFAPQVTTLPRTSQERPSRPRHRHIFEGLVANPGRLFWREGVLHKHRIHARADTPPRNPD